MRFIVDAQLPPALARLLTSHNHVVEHVSDIGMENANDKSIWTYALQNQAIIITKDEDFSLRQQQSRARPGIVWIRIGNTSRRALLQWFEPLIPAIVQLIEQGDRLIEIR
jgi:predicted nuclease of predicted toxin-antitoxin system